jgi:predicted ABC-class ATPase
VRINDNQQLIEETFSYANQNQNTFWTHLKVIRDQYELRNSISESNLIAFVANGSILPRQSGTSQFPMDTSKAKKFVSPPSLEREFTLYSGEVIRGMGIPQGVHLIVGGGFHGKTTLLSALQVGVYDKVPGDGREYVVTIDSTVTVRTEDGRRVSAVNISPFIDNLPMGISTHSFTTTDASGSTSQAANIIEALECGAKVLLIDEDRSAANFMLRDHRMQSLVVKEKEPITPFRFKVRQLFTEHGVSSVLAMGGSSDYFEVADSVVMMECYSPFDVSQKVSQIVRSFPTNIVEEV